MFKNASGSLFGIGAQANRPWWVEIRVSGTSGPTFTPTPTATATQTNTSNWNTYQNAKYKFTFKFPPGSITTSQTDTAGRIFLPILTPGTNLSEKILDITAVENANPCKTPTTGATTSETVTINTITFTKETGANAASGHKYEFVAYSTKKDIACISLTFTLHSLDQGNVPNPLPIFNKTAESAVFDTIMSTFALTQ
jgi:hypothetical protein